MFRVAPRHCHSPETCRPPARPLSAAGHFEIHPTAPQQGYPCWPRAMERSYGPTGGADVSRSWCTTRPTNHTIAIATGIH